MLDSDEEAKEIPVNREAWKRWFPHLEALIGRIRAARPLRPLRIHQAEALVGGQGRGDRRRRPRDPAEHRAGRRLRDDECAVAGGLSRPRARHRRRRSPPGSDNERAITDHTQRISLMLGWPTTWPPASARQGAWRWPANRNGWCASAPRRRCTSDGDVASVSLLKLRAHASWRADGDHCCHASSPGCAPGSGATAIKTAG